MALPPNNIDWKTKSGIKGVQMLVADMVGNATEIVFLRYQDKIDNALPFLKSGFKKIMYLPMAALQDPIEKLLDLFPSIEGKESHDKRIKQPAEKRLDSLLDTSYHFTSAIGVGWGSLVLAEKGLSRGMKGTNMPKELPQRMWMGVDLPVHLGIMAMLGTSFAKPATDVMKNVSKKLFLAIGCTEEQAENNARFSVAYIIPNYLTLIPTTMMMTSLYHAESKGLVKDIGVSKKSWLGFDAHEHHFVATGTSVASRDLNIIENSLLRVAKGLGIIGAPSASKSTVSA